MSDTHVKYLLIGGGLASSSAAHAIRAIDHEGSILLVGQEASRPYRRLPLSSDYLLGRTSRQQLFIEEEQWFVRNHVELRSGRRAAHLEVDRHSVILDTGEEVAFDKLLIATGAVARHLGVVGADLANVLHVRTVDDADRLRQAAGKALREGRPYDGGRGLVVVIGGGAQGVELAGTLRELGLHVDLIVRKPAPWARFADEMLGRFARGLLEGRGVRVRTQTSVVRVEGDGRAQRVVLSDGAALPCDFVAVAVGVEAQKEIIRATALRAEKAILVDEHCRASHPDIYAAGDCAAMLDPLYGKHRYLGHWESASETGALAGRNMAGIESAYGAVSHFVTSVAGVSLNVWGESRIVERRLARGTLSLEKLDFAEIGVDRDGRVAQVVAMGEAARDPLLPQLVARRMCVTGREEAIKDPTCPLIDLA